MSESDSTEIVASSRLWLGYMINFALVIILFKTSWSWAAVFSKNDLYSCHLFRAFLHKCPNNNYRSSVTVLHLGFNNTHFQAKMVVNCR